MTLRSHHGWEIPKISASTNGNVMELFFRDLQQTMFDWQSVFVIFCNDPFPVVKRGNWKSHKSPIH